MLAEAHVKDMREILQATGIRKWRIQNAVVKAIHTDQLQQKTKESAILVPSGITVEDFMAAVLEKFKKNYALVDLSQLSPSARKLYHTLSQK